MNTQRCLLGLTGVVGSAIRCLNNGLKLCFASHLTNDADKQRVIFTNLTDVDVDLLKISDELHNNAQKISEIYYDEPKSSEIERFDKVLSSPHSLLENAYVLTLRYAVIYEALQILPKDYPDIQKRKLEAKFRSVAMKIEKLQTHFEKINDISLAEAVHDSIVILKAAENGISIEDADKQERQRWS